jgi:hypothetical protein
MFFRNWLAILAVLSCSLAFNGCYSLKGFSIDYNQTKSFSVKTFELQAPTAPPLLNINFSEQLRQRVRTNTRLQYIATASADINFTGAITGYNVTTVAAQNSNTVVGATAQLQQLEIIIQVNYENTKDEKKNWTETLRYQTTFPASQTLTSVQDQLFLEASNNIIDQIFNKAFSNW